jgi:homoserine dehydrogenase
MQKKELTIGLFGFGCVGYGLYQVLGKTNGLKANIKTIVVKQKNKKREIDAEHFSYDKQDILNDPDINVVVELIDDADAAFEIVSTALRNGKAVVSANKKMIAEHFDELLDLQGRYDVPLLYEAACCASIPIIRNLEEYYNNDLLESIEGIVNGSTNYILTKTISENLSYAQALKQAQDLGFAETDPTLDTGGYDAKFKLLILLAHAFGIVARPKNIFHLGIEQISDLEIAYAREKNLRIKLVAQAYKQESGKVSCFVMPKFVSPLHQLGTVDDVFNGVITKTSFADKQFFAGRGAGAYPTASAVLSDISALAYDYRYEYKKLSQGDQLEKDDAIFLNVFFRHKKSVTAEHILSFELVDESYTKQDNAYITGIIRLDKLKAIQSQHKDISFVLLETLNGYQPILQPIIQNHYELAE